MEREMFGFYVLFILAQEIDKSIIECVGPYVGLTDSMINLQRRWIKYE